MNRRKRSENGNKCIIFVADMGLSVLFGVIVTPKRPKVNTEGITERKIIVLLLIRLFVRERTHIEWDIDIDSMGKSTSPTPSETPFEGRISLLRV